MMPGPLFAASVTYGLKQGVRSGIKMAIGHTIVELPLVVLLGIGTLSLDILPQFRLIITVFGALSLFAFAAIQTITIIKNRTSTVYGSKYGPLYAGIVFSALNPFFIVWWLTIGFKLITDAMLVWSFVGVFVMFGIHIWMDFVWLGAVSFLASSLKFISSRNYKLIIIALSMMMIYLGILFLIEINKLKDY